jgi:hypothetical protein
MADIEDSQDPDKHRGILYRLDPDYSCHVMDEGIAVVNGTFLSFSDQLLKGERRLCVHGVFACLILTLTCIHFFFFLYRRRMLDP